jgi:hypothetical protein
MKEFPSWLKPTSAHIFNKKYNELAEEMYREHIFNLLLTRENEEDYFDIELTRRTYTPTLTLPMIMTIMTKIITELHTLGWKTKLAFAQSGLFIYTDKLPKNCW